MFSSNFDRNHNKKKNFSTKIYRKSCKIEILFSLNFNRNSNIKKNFLTKIYRKKNCKIEILFSLNFDRNSNIKKNFLKNIYRKIHKNTTFSKTYIHICAKIVMNIGNLTLIKHQNLVILTSKF